MLHLFFKGRDGKLSYHISEHESSSCPTNTLFCKSHLIIIIYMYSHICVMHQDNFSTKKHFITILPRLPQMAMCIQCTRGCCMDGMALGGGGCVQV